MSAATTICCSVGVAVALIVGLIALHQTPALAPGARRPAVRPLGTGADAALARA